MKNTNGSPPNDKPSQELTTEEEILSSIKTKVVTLASGRRFEIQSFNTGNLLFHLGHPHIDAILTAEEVTLRGATLETPGTAVCEYWQEIKRIVCDNVISIRLKDKRQSDLPKGYVSIMMLSIMEIQELFLNIRDLSISQEELEREREDFKRGRKRYFPDDP